ncbi:hypothetical protein [Bacillus piscicola]|uniref:hypothetical protein n=1 Tax=Bacillus piscicola TaxID=1632684 RepID=UPI001F08EE64|nr:hypothetical protein [Bacillus piscicola]
MAEQEGLEAYITWKWDEKDHDDRRFEFASTMSHFNTKQLKWLFKRAKDWIGEILPVLHQRLESYQKCEEASSLPGMVTYRDIAHFHQFDVEWYVEKEYQLLEHARVHGVDQALHWFGACFSERLAQHRQRFPLEEWKFEDYLLAHAPLLP